MEEKSKQSKSERAKSAIGYLLVVLLCSLVALAVLVGAGYKFSREYGHEEENHTIVSSTEAVN